MLAVVGALASKVAASRKEEEEEEKEAWVSEAKVKPLARRSSNRELQQHYCRRPNRRHHLPEGLSGCLMGYLLPLPAEAGCR